jgi:hypothetical protein
MKLKDLEVVDTVTASESGASLVLKKLDGSPLRNSKGEEMTLTLLGPDSRKYRELQRAQVKKRLNRSKAKRQDIEADMEEAEADAIDLMVGCTVAWGGFCDDEGNIVAHTPQNIRSIYASYPIIRDQVDAFITERANFLQASPDA